MCVNTVNTHQASRGHRVHYFRNHINQSNFEPQDYSKISRGIYELLFTNTFENAIKLHLYTKFNYITLEIDSKTSDLENKVSKLPGNFRLDLSNALSSLRHDNNGLRLQLLNDLDVKSSRPNYATEHKIRKKKTLRLNNIKKL